MTSLVWRGHSCPRSVATTKHGQEWPRHTKDGCGWLSFTLTRMLSDLDTLMAARGIGSVIVPMHEAMHASFRWIARGAKVTRGYAVKLHGRDPLLVTYSMERDEAAATGLEVALVHAFGYDAIFSTASNPAAAYAEFFDRVLHERGAEGSVAFFGNAPIALYVGIAERSSVAADMSIDRTARN